MWVAITSVAALAGVGALVLVSARLAGAFAQLQAVAAVQPAPSRTASAGRPETAPRGETVELVAEAGDLAAPTVSETPPMSTNAHAPAASGGDEHILRMLAADPEFARGAEELLNDPDPQTQEEARRLLRDLGVGTP